MTRIEIKKTELVWRGKYTEDGKLRPVEKQVLIHSNERTSC